MAKKHKKILKNAKKGMRILKSGKIKIGGEKIDLTPIINFSTTDSIVSRLDAIISKERVAIEDGDKVCLTETVLQDPVYIAELEAHVAFTNDKYPAIRTIVIPMTKKEAVESFDFLNVGILGEILRSSTLASSYKPLKEQWVELNENDTTGFTNVLYVPKVMMFLDPDTGKFKKHPYRVNVLILALPQKNKIKGDVDTDVTDEDAVERAIIDIVESSIRVGSKIILVDPYYHKWLRNDIRLTAEKWKDIMESNKFQENFELVSFCFEEESKYITFNGITRDD